MENKGYTITKLNGQNYFVWRMKMELVLKKEKLWNLVTNDPPETITEHWSVNDMSTKATIGLALEDQILVNVDSCVTAKETWEKLKRLYQHTHLSSKLGLLKKLYGCNYNDFNNMEAYLNKIKELCERLRSCGESIKESHIVAVMLCGLPSDYDAIVTAIEAKEEKDINAEYIGEKLRDEAMRKENQYCQTEKQDVVMGASHRSNNPTTRGKIVCYKCGREGHIQRLCRYEANSKEHRQREEKPAENTTSTQRGYAVFQSQEEGEEDSKKRQTISLEDEWALSGETNEIEKTQDTWIIDSGASAHMTHDRNNIKDYKNAQSEVAINLANGEKIYSPGKGEVELKTNDLNKTGKSIILKDVLWVPMLKQNLISVKTLCKNGTNVMFNNSECKIIKDQDLIAECKSSGNVYVLKTEKVVGGDQVAATCIHGWHRRLGHRNIPNIKLMKRENMAINLDIDKCEHTDSCQICPMGAMTQKTFKPRIKTENRPFKALVSDLCGPIEPCTMGGKRYFMTITDIGTSYAHLELLRNKGEASQKIMDYIKIGRNKFGYLPEILRTDGGGEYGDKVFADYLRENGIVHQTSIPYTPQQNGKAERLNRTVLEAMRRMIKDAEVPLELWGEAAMMAIYSYNRVKNASTIRTPYEAWNNKSPDLGHLRVFGCIAFAYINKQNRNKLGDTAVKGRMVGYSIGKKGYRIWIEGTKRIVNAASVEFQEHKTEQKVKIYDNEEGIIVIPQELMKEEPTNQQPEKCEEDRVIRRSERSTKGIPPDRLTL